MVSLFRLGAGVHVVGARGRVVCACRGRSAPNPIRWSIVAPRARYGAWAGDVARSPDRQCSAACDMA
jgi:hypothetical protein